MHQVVQQEVNMFNFFRILFTHFITLFQVSKIERNRFTAEYVLQQNERLHSDLHDTAELAKYRYIKYQYLHSPAWNRKRKQVFYRDKYRCIVCNSEKRLEAHHISSYEFIPHEPLSAIITLCRSCHQKEHDLHGYPQTYLDYINWNVPIPKSRTLLKHDFTYTT